MQWSQHFFLILFFISIVLHHDVISMHDDGSSSHAEDGPSFAMMGEGVVDNMEIYEAHFREMLQSGKPLQFFKNTPERLIPEGTLVPPAPPVPPRQPAYRDSPRPSMPLVAPLVPPASQFIRAGTSERSQVTLRQLWEQNAECLAQLAQLEKKLEIQHILVMRQLNCFQNSVLAKMSDGSDASDSGNDHGEDDIRVMRILAQLNVRAHGVKERAVGVVRNNHRIRSGGTGTKGRKGRLVGAAYKPSGRLQTRQKS